jgi:hypothetical protein
MPRVQPDEPTIPRRPLEVGDLVTVHQGTTPWRIAAIDGPLATIDWPWTAPHKIHVDHLHRYHGTQRP